MEQQQSETVDLVLQDSETFSANKFHKILGKNLSVALEATLDSSDPSPFDGGKDILETNPHLIYKNGNCYRAYHPATEDGDLYSKEKIQIKFMPWFSIPSVLCYRIIFRKVQIGDKTKTPQMVFARFGETKSFDFQSSGFLPLQLMTIAGDKVFDNFVPLFLKVKESKETFYLKIEVTCNEEATILEASKVPESETPQHLISSQL